jgi:hypothetical protein
MHWIVGNHAERSAFDAHQRRDHANTKAAAEFEHRIGVKEGLDDLAYIVDAPAIFWNQMAKFALVRAVPIGDRALKIAEIALRFGHGFDFVSDEEIYDSGGFEHRSRPDLTRFKNTEAATFDHGRTAHAEIRILGGDDDVRTTCEGRAASEAESRNDTHPRYFA